MVFGLLRRVFRYYCDHHLLIETPGFPLVGAEGEKIGHVDRLKFGRGTTRIEGWSIADKVSLGHASELQWAPLNVRRDDVNRKLGLREGVLSGFDLVSNGPQLGLLFSVKLGNTIVRTVCAGPSYWQRCKAKLRLTFSFAKDLLSAPLVFLRAAVRPTMENKAKAKNALRVRQSNKITVLDARDFEVSKVGHPARKITIIMPVYNAYDVLCRALERVVTNTDISWRMILVEDASTDERVRPMLRAWCQKQQMLGHEITLLENAKNQGFIRSVNRAFEQALAYQGHVVLLNSDALVPRGWASRLFHPIVRNSKVASVTPLSNDAEIFSAPRACQSNQLEDGVADYIDHSLRQQVSSEAYKRAPTGVGFCMAINRKFLRKLPEFDVGFGMGYGEEVDWCQKASSLGGMHVVQPSVFVEHVGGASFGNLAKEAAIAKNNQIISSRYPNYDKRVQDFIDDDPIASARLLVALANASISAMRLKVYVAHSLGGGAELYLQDKIKLSSSRDQSTVVLRVGGAQRWRIEVHSAVGIIQGATNDTALVLKLLDFEKPIHLIYSCAVGDKDPLSLPANLLAIAEQNDTFFTFLVHDYFAVSPSYCLLGSDSVYRGVPAPRNSDPAHGLKARNGALISNEKWRENWAKLIDIADEVECFSQNSARLFQEAFPATTDLIAISAHQVTGVTKMKPPNRNTPTVIGVLGDIGPQKGAACLEALAKAITETDALKIVVIGSVDPSISLAPSVLELGKYLREDIVRHAEKHGVGAWFIPSIWPETFSYTTHEALATGLPVFSFDLGAQGDAVTGAPNGHAMPRNWIETPSIILSYIKKVIENADTSRGPDSRPEELRNRGAAA